MKHIKSDFRLKAWVRAPCLTFSEYGHVAYQIKVENVCSNMVANILPTDTPSVNPYIFMKVVMLHIKIK